MENWNFSFENIASRKDLFFVKISSEVEEEMKQNVFPTKSRDMLNNKVNSIRLLFFSLVHCQKKKNFDNDKIKS